VALRRRASRSAFSSRSTAWLVPPTVIARAWAMSYTRHRAVASTTIRTSSERRAVIHQLLRDAPFALGSATGSIALASSLARLTGLNVVAVDYRLAPEDPYPAAVDDTVNAYRALREREGDSADIVASGESVGGNLARLPGVRRRPGRGRRGPGPGRPLHPEPPHDALTGAPVTNPSCRGRP
jgi:hypothetical protein